MKPKVDKTVVKDVKKKKKKNYKNTEFSLNILRMSFYSIQVNIIAEL